MAKAYLRHTKVLTAKYFNFDFIMSSVFPAKGPFQLFYNVNVLHYLVRKVNFLIEKYP